MKHKKGTFYFFAAPASLWGGDQKGTACHGNSGITADSDWTRLMASDADTYYYSVCTVEQVTVNHLVGGSSPSRGANFSKSYVPLTLPF